MRWAALAVVVALAALLGTRSWEPEAALACSCGPDCDDIVHTADLIVEGRLTSWNRTDRYEPLGQFIPILLSMHVDRVFKGVVPAGFTLVDRASLHSTRQDREPTGWAGAAGACGTFDQDPVGHWIIAALYRDELGNYRISRLATVVSRKYRYV
jgi:hypothetical protein